MTSSSDLREWMFRGLMFESESERFRRAGIRVGADQQDAERSLLEETLNPYGVELRNEALMMCRLYALMYCFENSVRSLIEERLEERYGPSWWDSKVQRKIRQFSQNRQETAEKNSWLEGARRQPLAFVQFGHLADIISDNWEDFSDLVPSQHWLRQRMVELEQTRNFVAHHRLLLPGEFQRISMYVGDWIRSVGV